MKINNGTDINAPWSMLLIIFFNRFIRLLVCLKLV